MKSAAITTGARLHFGLLAHGQATGREFGGIGVMVDRPRFVLRAAPAPLDELNCGAWSGRIENFLARLRSGGATGVYTGPLRLDILESAAAHSGLGSGTQLGMAVAKILCVLADGREISGAELARRAGRGLRSALGLHGFQHGGLLIEAGQRGPGEISPLVARIDFPDRWRFVLARPAGSTGLSGVDETNSLAQLAPMPQAVTDRLCRIALMQILPAAIEHDFTPAAESIGQFGRLVGEYFAPVQGGVFAHERMRRLSCELEARKIQGFGQSSWGPTLFILCPDAEFADQLATDLANHPAGAGCEFTIAAPLNRGARVQVTDVAPMSNDECLKKPQ
jgi:beta-RFAP synthase